MERLLLVLEAAAQAEPQGVAARLTAMSLDVYVETVVAKLKVSLSLWHGTYGPLGFEWSWIPRVRPSESNSNGQIAAVLAGPWCLAIRRLSEVKLV